MVFQFTLKFDMFMWYTDIIFLVIYVPFRLLILFAFWRKQLYMIQYYSFYKIYLYIFHNYDDLLIVFNEKNHMIRQIWLNTLVFFKLLFEKS